MGEKWELGYSGHGRDDREKLLPAANIYNKQIAGIANIMPRLFHGHCRLFSERLGARRPEDGVDNHLNAAIAVSGRESIPFAEIDKEKSSSPLFTKINTSFLCRRQLIGVPANDLC